MHTTPIETPDTGTSHSCANGMGTVPATPTEPENTNARLDVLQKALIDLAQVFHDKIIADKNSPPVDQGWTELTSPRTVTNLPVRFDNIPPFPKAVKATSMWEAFTNSAQQAQLLYLALGDELQGIIRAAGLRPDPDCYRRMVNNISDYFRAMTDVSAEHDKFTAMKQDRGESTVAFRARLVLQVRLCKYSEEDQIRFVRSQILSVIKNRELARTARIFNHDTE